MEFCLYDNIQEFNKSRTEKFSSHAGCKGEKYEQFDSYTVGFWPGFDRIDYIKLTSGKLSMKIDGRKISFFHRSLIDIERQMGTDYHRLKNFDNIIEYMFKSDRTDRIDNIYIAFHFKDGECIAVEIYDEGRFV